MDEIIEEVRRHSREVGENECCGLVLEINGVLVYVPCHNTATDSRTRFVIAPEDYADAEDRGKVVMVCHSHVFESPEASEGDKVACERSGVPWLIVNYPTGDFRIIKPSGYRAPLLGRPFCIGTLDCYALVRDYYEEKLGITLKDYERPEGWETSGTSIILEQFKDCGFHEIPLEDLQPNDVLVMRVGADIANHVAVYIGDTQILHHVKNQLSARDVYGSFWRRATVKCLRYDQ